MIGSAGDVGFDGLGLDRRARLARRLYCLLDHGSFLSFRMVGVGVAGVCVGGGAEGDNGKCGVWSAGAGRIGWVESGLFLRCISGFAEVGHPRSISRFCGVGMFGVHGENDSGGGFWGWWAVLLLESAGAL